MLKIDISTDDFDFHYRPGVGGYYHNKPKGRELDIVATDSIDSFAWELAEQLGIRIEEKVNE
ncbi:hypothetical protein ACFL6N_04210 [Thermodesulfobacteriota bacterium]